jgi:O-antigen ligase/polysaccharide polymerase Wzy-like membrane protein
VTHDQELHRRQDNPAMTRLGGPAGGAAAFVLTACVACDAGGFNALTWDRAFVAVGALLLVLVILVDGARPGRSAAILLAALGGSAAWTALSWIWSESPPRALVEAQRVGLYAICAAAVVLAGRRVSPRSVEAGVAAGCTLVAVWNLWTRVRGVAHASDTGALAQPIGYANGLALVCAIGLLLLPRLPVLTWVAAPPLAADLALQSSSGALAGLAAGGLLYLFMVRPRLRAAVAVIAVAGLVAAPFAVRGHERTQYWHAAVTEVRAHPLLGSGAGTFSNWWLRERTVPVSTREAHSLYLETLAELGPIGLALLLVAVGTPLVAAVRAREPSIAASLIAYDVAAAVDFHWELAGVTLPAVLLAAAACVRATRATRAAPRRALVPALALVTAAAVLAWAGSSRLAAAQAALRVGDRAHAVAAARDALRFAPYSADAWRVIGDASRDPVAYRRALDLDRDDWSLWLALANVSKGKAHRLALHEAVRLNPLFSGR